MCTPPFSSEDATEFSDHILFSMTINIAVKSIQFLFSAFALINYNDCSLNKFENIENWLI